MAQGDDHSKAAPEPHPEPRSTRSGDDPSKLETAYTSFSVASVGLEMGVSVAVGLANSVDVVRRTPLEVLREE